MRAVKIDEIKLDNNLMFLIQYTTKQKTQDIMGYFFELAKDIAETKSSARLNKSMVYQYPETKIPYKIEVRSGYYTKDSEALRVYVNVTFPRKADYFDGTELLAKLESAFEASIGLTELEEMPPFEEPKFKVPTGVRKKRGIKYERPKAKVSAEPVSASGQRAEQDTRDDQGASSGGTAAV